MYLTKRGRRPRKTLPIADLVIDLLRAAGPEGLTVDDLCKRIYGDTSLPKYRANMRSTLHRLRLSGRVASYHPPTRHILLR